MKRQARQPETRPRRLARQYRHHLETIARLWVQSGKCQADTVRLVQVTLPQLKSFKGRRLVAWADNPEWQAAVRAAETQSTAERELPPDVRGAKLLKWAKEALAHIEAQYEVAKKDGDDKERGNLEKRLLTIHDSVRAEERHQDALKTQARLRDFSSFVANVITLLRGVPAEYEQRLREVMKDPGKLMGVTVE